MTDLLRTSLKTLAAAAMCLGAAGTAIAADDEEYRIALKLFGNQDIEGGPSRCRFSLWQDDRDPDEDRYAYLLNVNFGNDDYYGQAQIKIGSDVYFLTELVQGGEPIDGLNSQYVYATEDRRIGVHVELRDVNLRDGEFEIDDAGMTIVQQNKISFYARAKGVSGCSAPPPEPAQADATPVDNPDYPAGIPIGTEVLLNDLAEVPAVLKQQLREFAADQCDIGGYMPWSGARYVINDYYLLWQVPCYSGAYQGAGVFGVTQNPPQGWGELLTLPNPPGLEGNQNYAAVNAEVLGASGLIKTTYVSRGVGDCGIYQVFRLTDGPGEVLELELLEYREKTDCDGNATPPQEWPLAYRSY